MSDQSFTDTSDILRRARQFVVDGGSDEDDMDVVLARKELIERIDDALSLGVAQASGRIEALEKALRDTAETAAGELNYTGQSRSTRAALQKINVMARAALAPGQDK